jgi:hypothetical protein
MPNGLANLKERIYKNLPGAPTVKLINVFELQEQQEKEGKINYLKEKCGINQLVETINYEGL